MDLTTPTLTHKQKMDVFEAENAKLPQVDCPLVHRFTDGMYSREIHMPAGTIVTSRTHKTQHPFVILKGVCEVVREDDSREILSAPYIGITEAGTRRILIIHEDTVWVTFHATALTDPEEIADTITESTNDLLPNNFRHICFENREVLE